MLRRKNVDEKQWEKVLSAQTLIQQKFPDCVLVGVTASALHCGHRFSYDGDHILPDLKHKFDEILRQLEEISGWRTSRLNPPVLILGKLYGVETGIRQLIRKKPLETIVVKGVRVPTLEEMTRIKGYLVVTRNATRDYIDFVALADKVEKEGKGVVESLRNLDELYPQEEETITRQLAKQLAEPKPYDLVDPEELKSYRGLRSPYNDWCWIKNRLNDLATVITEQLVLNFSNEGNHETSAPER